MFKKERDLTERSKTLLKNKEIRTFKQDIQKQFPLIDEETLNTLIPNKADVHNIKLSNRTILYSIDGQVIFYDYQGRNNLYPTLHTLWKCPNMMRTMYTYGPVSRYVLRGADFMIPGLATLSNLSGLRENEKVSISIVGNPLPFAVGDCHVNEDGLLDRDGHKMKGKGVTIMHSYGDLLVSSKLTPNDGFTPEEIFPTEKLSDEVKKVIVDATESREAGDTEVAVDNEGEKILDGENDSGEGQEVDGENHCDDPEVVGVSHSLEETSLQASDSQQVDKVEEEEDDGTAALELKRRDEQLMESLILAFKYIIKEKQLPMLVSVFWSTLQRCSQCSTTFDNNGIIDLIEIKKTSYKKVTKFLEYCKSIDLLTYRDDNGIATITGIKRMHDLFREYKVDDPDKFKESVKLRETNSSSTGASGNSDSIGYHGSNPNGNSKITVIDLFKMPRNLKDIFGNIRGEYGDHLKSNEVSESLFVIVVDNIDSLSLSFLIHRFVIC